MVKRGSVSQDSEHDRWGELLHAAAATTDYRRFGTLVRTRKKLLEAGVQPDRRKTVRLALLGTANTHFCSGPLALALECLGIGAEIHCTDYGTYAHEIMDHGSSLHRFRPDVVHFVNSPFVQPEWSSHDQDREQVERTVTDVVDHWLGLCERLNATLGCEIVFDNFHRPDVRPLGNLSARVPGTAVAFLARVNAELSRRAPSFVHINDVDWLASLHGVARWHDPRFWYHAKQATSFECLAHYAHNSARVIASIYGSPRKVLVLDLDNTLWGGVIGDDGLEGIRIGQGSSEGEAFLAFQRYLLDLKARGVLLAVCSKNEDANARLPFTDHPEMVLRLDDLVSFRANWEPKPNNLLEMARELNLGIDSFVFVDDNPAERDLMRLRLPQVLTVEVGADPEHYSRILDQCAPFEISALSSEDARRTEQYRGNSERERLLTTAGAYREYLEALKQQARIGPFQPQRLDRITQLINKTNQFNLTTIRMTHTEVAQLLSDERKVTVAVELSDRFGDNGLIAAVVGSVRDGALAIDLWLMSCRVLKREVERLLCNYLVAVARERRIERIEGVYAPSKRNAIVKDHYATLGFECIEQAPDGATRWALDVRSYEATPTPIEVT